MPIYTGVKGIMLALLTCVLAGVFVWNIFNGIAGLVNRGISLPGFGRFKFLRGTYKGSTAAVAGIMSIMFGLSGILLIVIAIYFNTGFVQAVIAEQGKIIKIGLIILALYFLFSSIWVLADKIRQEGNALSTLIVPIIVAVSVSLIVFAVLRLSPNDPSRRTVPLTKGTYTGPRPT